MRQHLRAHALGCAAAAVLAGLIAPQAVHAQEANYSFNIPPQDLGSALRAYASVTRQQLTFDSRVLEGRQSPPLVGAFSSSDALRRLLTGSGLNVKRTNSGVIIIGAGVMPVSYQAGPVSTAAAPPSAAQASGAAPLTDQAQSVGEVVVTARKRQETLLNAPVVANVVTGATLERRATTDLKDVSRVVPGLSLSQTLGVSGVQVSLRGVGTSAQNAGIDASVALNIDGMQITQGIAYSSAMFDLERIEVLKGPQALFFGKNSPGGVISLRSADPTNRFELIGSYGYEAVAQEHRAQLIISGPVTDSLKLRLATQFDRQAGYFENNAVKPGGLENGAGSGSRGPADKGYVIRGTALWQPIDQFDARLKLNITHDRLTGGVGLQLVSCPDGTGAVPPRNIPFLGGEDCRKDRVINLVGADPGAFRHLLDNTTSYFNDTYQNFGSLELNYRPRPDITLTSVTGYYYLKFRSQQSASLSTFAGPGLISLVDPFTRHEFTEEVRANSDFAGPLNFTAGAFFERGRLFFHPSLPANVALGAPAQLSNFEDLVHIETSSAFGQARWRIISGLELSAGARWTHETRDLTAWNLITGVPVLVPTAQPKIGSDNISPEVTLTYKPSEDITTFASYKEGFKSGSFNLAALVGVRPDQSFGDEKVKGWEVGAKARLLDRRLFTSVAFYDYRYSGLQVGVSATSANGVPVARTLNAGAAKVYGVDLDLNYLPPLVDGLTLNGSVEWNHARFTDLHDVPCWGGQTIAAGCTEVLNPNTGLFTSQNLSGLPLLRAPEWQANFGFTYEAPIGHDLTVSISNTNQYSSSYLANLGLRSDFYQPKFFKTDLTLTLKGPRDRWEFALIGKNLADKLTSGGCATTNAQNGVVFGGEVTGGTGRGPAGVDELACYMDRGREIWMRVTLRPFN